MKLRQVRAGLLSAFLLVSLARCGITQYPGQPGMVSNSYVKIDMEYLDTEGLFFYEASYDNQPGGAGVGAVVTKLYPGAKTYTSNVRTNADGTLFRTKGQYDGAELQTIFMPKLNQLYVAPESKVAFLVSYDYSLDEVDDRNLAEKGIFKGAARITERALASLSRRIQWLRAGTLTRSGTLAYTVTAVRFGAEEYVPAAPVTLEASIQGNALRTDLSADARKDLLAFVESRFPKGFEGTVSLTVKGAGKPLSAPLGVHTLKTAEAAGINITHSSRTEMERIAARYLGRNS